MQKSTDYLAEHGFVETTCYICHELLILPEEKYQKYVAYKHDYCKEHRPINPYWKVQLTFIAVIFFPGWAVVPMAGAEYLWGSTGWLAWGLCLAWGIACMLCILYGLVDDIIHDQGGY